MIDLNDIAVPKTRYDLAAVKERLACTAADWLPGLFPEARLARDRRSLRCADLSGRPPRKEGSCTIHLDGPYAGWGFDYATGERAGPIDLIAHGDNGLLLEVETFEQELNDAARWILDDARHATLQAAARESVADKTWAALGDQLLGYYTEVLETYERNVVHLFGRDVALPRWAPARLGQPRRQARRDDTA